MPSTSPVISFSGKTEGMHSFSRATNPFEGHPRQSLLDVASSWKTEATGHSVCPQKGLWYMAHESASERGTPVGTTASCSNPKCCPCEVSHGHIIDPLVKLFTARDPARSSSQFMWSFCCLVHRRFSFE